MADTTNKLPEGTDTIIEAGGAGGTGGGTGRSGTTNQGGSTSSTGNATGGRTSVTASTTQTDALITGTSGTSTGAAGGGSSMGGSTGSTDREGGSDNQGGIRGVLSNVTTKARDEATGRARGFVGDGLKSGSATLGNISTLIGDTVEQIEEKLGPQYAGYARTASDTIQRYATTLENKDPDELVDDARELIRKSPGVAIAGAAIIGFGLVRLLKAGMPDDDAAERRAGSRRRSDLD